MKHCHCHAEHITMYKSSEHQLSLEHSCVATKNFKTQEQILLDDLNPIPNFEAM